MIKLRYPIILTICSYGTWQKNSYHTWKKSFVSEPIYLSNASSAPSPSTVAEESEDEEIIPEADGHFGMVMDCSSYWNGKLTNLQTLSAFLVGKKDGNRIAQLRNMNKLKGSLCILKLENILNKEEARDARLHDKLHLTKLEFIWSDLQDAKVTSEEEILEHLQPHFGLQELKIVSYSGGSLPSWISDPSFTQVTSITLYGCRYCERLPSLGELPSLKILNIVDMDELVVIDRLFYQQQANQRQNAFPRLEQLSFDGMSNLEIWTGIEEGHFPCLQLLTIRFCPRLTASISFIFELPPTF
ncbi:UNVERIFIED_CONTAM: putative disease resistance protein RGA1 [Sesamum latifolium]|uniref:Disease resistance protein RGA1 n=1 Tax=Sesamum latifolium TaxID=2727402 RepID=A0AAW2XM08_9LAMI